MPDTFVVPDKATAETLQSIHRWTENLFSFRISRPAGYLFVPGQFSRLGLYDNEELVWRAYSIVSGATDEWLEYFMISAPDGQFSRLMEQLHVGDPILLDKTPFGFMTVDRFTDGDDLWMLSTGTGLGPFISILKDPATWEKFEHLIVVHCVRHSDELAYQAFFAELAASLERAAKLTVICSTTRDSATLHARHVHDRLPALIGSGLLESTAGRSISIEKSRFLVCGNPEMINSVREVLHSRGMRPCRRATPGQFVTEDYW